MCTTVQAYRPAYDGDPRPPDAAATLSRPPEPLASARVVRGSASGQFNEEFEAFFDLARTDADSAHQLLQIFTFRCRSLEAFDQERRFLIDSGIPATLLRDALGLGRLDLLPWPG